MSLNVDSGRDLATEVTPLAFRGASVDDLPTPVLLVHEDALERNIRRMAERTGGPVRLRPHFKSHKSVELARRQVASGAIGITAATVWEAQALALAGVEDVLIANEVIDPGKLQIAAGVAAKCHLTVAVDSAMGIHALSSAAAAARVLIHVVLEFDVGMGRAGVRDIDEGLALAGQIGDAPGLDFVGVMGYEGHCVLEPDAGRRRSLAGAAIDRLAEAAEKLRAAGQRVAVVSAGGTGTADFTGSDPRVTDIQAGSYVYMDTVYEEIVPTFRPALTVLCTVVSRHADTAVLDCGLKTIAPSVASKGRPRLVGGGGSVRYVSEEHTVLDLDSTARIEVGDRVEMVSGHCCETVNLHDQVFLVEHNQILEVWRTRGRGPGGLVRNATGQTRSPSGAAGPDGLSK